MLFFPSKTLLGATDGLLLWFQILIPTLLPSLILTNVLIQSNSLRLIVKYAGPLFQKIFRVSPNGSFAVLCGFLCGYPVGAKVIADLVKKNKITLSEGNYLLSFCNNTSPTFISGYIIMQQFQDRTLLVPSLCIIYISPYVCSLLFRKIYKFEQVSYPLDKMSSHFNFQILDDSIMNAFETITKIGGYLILFSIIFQLGKQSIFHNVLPFLEITNGILYYLSDVKRFQTSYIFVMSLASFGGLCSIAQTSSVIQGSNLSLLRYTIEKLITALVTSLFAFLYVTIILG